MNATVLVERIGTGKYRASTGQPVPLTSEGRSRDDAVRRLLRLARKRVSAGELIEVNLLPSVGGNPWQEFAALGPTLTRRRWLQLGGLGTLGLSLPHLLQAGRPGGRAPGR